MLRRLKELAKRAGVGGEVILHKFRKTYATLQHRAGVDARTIQKRLGHSDLATTLAYLEGEESRSERSRQQVNGTFGVFGDQAVAVQ
jgi:integrase